MRGVLLLAARDARGTLDSLWGLIVLSLAMVADGVLFLALGRGAVAEYSAEVLARFFLVHGVVSLVLATFFGVRAIAEERNGRTWVLLRASPLDDRHLTLGKYAAVMVVIALFSAFTAYIPAMVAIHGRVSGAHVLVGYAGAVGLSSVGAAVGIWASTFTHRQVFAAVLAAAALVPVVAGSLVSRVVDPPFRGVWAYLSLVQHHLRPFTEGQANSETFWFFGALTFVFLLMATQSLCGRRWA